MMNTILKFTICTVFFFTAIMLHAEPSEARAYFNFIRGMEKHKLGKYAEAIADYDKAIALDPNLAAAHQNRAEVKARLKGAGQ